jgi:diguanylate cyclase (GGDEF)-like protein
VRAKVQAMELPFDGRSVRVTVSMGVALSRPGEPLDRLLERADVALYEAKSQGRNRVVLQDEATPGV